MKNHFELFHLPAQFDVDMARLDSAFREVQAQVHPDKFADASSVEQRVAMQWATRANEAYQTLKNPLKRARYLCELHGVGLETESNTAMPPEFLMQQMEWREEFDESKDDPITLSQLAKKIGHEHEKQMQEIAAQLKQQDFHAAAQSIRQLMFLDKLNDELDERLAYES
jgi:molecular chaperone HscB